jgi:hypothetical protein
MGPVIGLGALDPNPSNALKANLGLLIDRDGLRARPLGPLVAALSGAEGSDNAESLESSDSPEFPLFPSASVSSPCSASSSSGDLLSAAPASAAGTNETVPCRGLPEFEMF